MNTAKIVYLHDPPFIELEDAYRGLTHLSYLHVKTANPEEIMANLEKIGFVAICILSFNNENRSYMFRASKGKHGPCFYSGLKITYNGIALAAIDDDNHVFINNRETSVCDKTARILHLPDYGALVTCEKAEAGTGKEEDDFEQSLESLSGLLSGSNENSSARTPYLYSGPFRFLIMNDGLIIRRGTRATIPEKFDKDLLIREGFKDWGHGASYAQIYFQDVYQREGAAYLMDHVRPALANSPDYETDLSKLKGISKRFKRRLIKVIENERKYFVLIGNEAEDKLGCCPSEEVTEANAFVRSGILDSLSEKTRGDACPVTLYAFKHELSTDETGFSCKLNDEFRSGIYERLTAPSPSNIQLILKWLLLIFVCLSLMLAARRCMNDRNDAGHKSLYEILDPERDAAFRVVLFHNRKRCFQCERMERYTRDVVQILSEDENSTRRIKFDRIIIDDPVNTEVIEQYGIFTSTLILVSFEAEKIKNAKVLLEASNLYRDEKAFKAYLKFEMQDFLAEADD
ncbi:MAG: nitrophenyl compound nitroreductase subunit ArsF family protein [Cytophagales bacterium]|nr:nitrophenyl compound nitroreductase subunit ArsF family protein [Cytophagales bacterium]